MQMLKKLSYVLTAILLAAGGLMAQTGDTVLVMPFENISPGQDLKAQFNWIGESFADSLADLLKVPTVNIVPNEERKIIQQRLRVPLTTLPSRATSLKMARDANATLLVSGRYTIIPATNDVAATINVTAQIVRVNEGRFMSEIIDGRQVTRDITLTDALGNLQTIQGQIAYQILYQRDKALPYSQNDLVVAANKVPARAFEAYTKGLLIPSPEARENYFKNASRLYTEALPEGTYSEAELELGHLYMGQRKFPDAIASFEKVIAANQRCRDKGKAASKQVSCGDEGYAEASFYIGLIYWQQGNFETALATLRPLTEDLKLTTVYNALGAIAIQAARAEKKNPARAAGLLTEGVDLLKRAYESAPDDPSIRFNYAAALFLSADYQAATPQLRAAIAANPKDGDAYYLLAKSLEALKDPGVTDVDNQARRFLTDSNRYATLEKEWQKSKTVPDINLRVQQPPRKDFVAVVLSRKPITSTTPQVSETDTLLAQARTLIKSGNDDEAAEELRRVRVSEPMSAEPYLMMGKINLRHGEKDQAISQFKTAIFWDNHLIEAHVSLSRIYYDKGDCLQAKNYAASAAEIDPENQDVQALQRSMERCSK